jgi:hypothetical protein
MSGSHCLGTASKLRKAGIFSRVDDSNTSIGKRYARNDELGTPFGVTLDFACEYGPDDEPAKGADIDGLTHSGPEPDDDTSVSGIHFIGRKPTSHRNLGNATQPDN